MSALRLGLVPALPALAACADFPAAVDRTGGVPDVAVAAPTFDRDVAPMLERRCASGGCHTPLSRQADLVLTADEGYGMLVGRRAAFAPTLDRVRPGRSDSSWLVAMIGPDASRRRGLPRMPLAATPLTDNQIATIVRWIDRGAPRD